MWIGLSIWSIKYLKQIQHLTDFVYTFSAGERFDPESKGKWDEDWEKNKSSFPFSEKLGEISDKIGSTIDDTINKFRKKERDDSPDHIRYMTMSFQSIELIKP